MAPLPLTNSSYRQACCGLSPPSCNACQAHQSKRILNAFLVKSIRFFVWVNLMRQPLFKIFLFKCRIFYLVDVDKTRKQWYNRIEVLCNGKR